jgi:hypothetical protein
VNFSDKFEISLSLTGSSDSDIRNVEFMDHNNENVTTFLGSMMGGTLVTKNGRYYNYIIPIWLNNLSFLPCHHTDTVSGSPYFRSILIKLLEDIDVRGQDDGRRPTGPLGSSLLLLQLVRKACSTLSSCSVDIH